MTTTTKAKPIIFSGPMVRAIIDGRKSQTRRVIKPYPTDENGPYSGELLGPEWYEPAVVDKDGMLVPGKPVFGVYDCNGEFGLKCPCAPGDLLYVKEAFYCDLLPWANGGSLVTPEAIMKAREIQESTFYRADGECCQQIPECQCDDVGPTRWRTARFMPEYLSRLTLEVTRVRVERVQEINWRDAIEEGMKDPRRANLRTDRDRGPIGKLRELWDSLNAAKGYGWDSNPWCWAYDFKRVSA